jgi:hypothetical protein
MISLLIPLTALRKAVVIAGAKNVIEPKQDYKGSKGHEGI